MSTGGIANILHSCNAPLKTSFIIRLTLLVKWTAPWLRGIGLFFFFLNIILFIMNCILICTRFHLRPGSFVNSFTDQMESLFISASVSLPQLINETMYINNN
jgi:hypothetical protein